MEQISQFLKLRGAHQIRDEGHNLTGFSCCPNPGLRSLPYFSGYCTAVHCHIIYCCCITIGSYAHMIFSADIKGMFNMLNHIDGTRLSICLEKRHEVDADDTSLLRHQSQFVITFVPGQISQCTATGVRYRDWHPASLNGIEAGILTTVTEIYQYPVLVQGLDEFKTERGQTLSDPHEIKQARARHTANHGVLTKLSSSPPE